MFRPSSRRGFTMTEIVVTLMVIGIGIGLFNSLFFNSWSAYEDRIKRADLWNEANQVFEKMSVEGRNARVIDVTATESAKTASFINAADSSVTVFKITSAGQLTRLKNAETKIFSTHVVFEDSNFTKSGKNLIVDLKLSTSVLSRAIHITASTEVLPRN